MFKKIFFILFTSVSILSCSSLKVGSNMKKIELGMSKQEVVSILGTDYQTAGASTTRDGNFETLRFVDSLNGGWYLLTFQDGRLVEWFRDAVPPTQP